MPKIKFSPGLFLLIEGFILLPTVLLHSGFLLAIFHKPELLEIIVSQSFPRFMFILIICPVSGGFVSYQYLERYGARGMIKKITQGILAYCIIGTGLSILYMVSMLL